MTQRVDYTGLMGMWVIRPGNIQSACIGKVIGWGVRDAEGTYLKVLQGEGSQRISEWKEVAAMTYFSDYMVAVGVFVRNQRERT